MRGFTLVELLVSLTLLALSSLLMLGGMTTGRQAWQRIETRAAAGEDVAALQRQLRETLENIYPLGRADASRPYSDIDGTSSGLRFVQRSITGGGLNTYYLARQPGGALRLLSRPLLSTRGASDDPAGVGWQAQLLATGVKSFTISYRGEAGPAGEASWQDRWQQQAAPPQLIAIDLAFEDGRRFPRLLIRPRASVNSLCIIDVRSGACRGSA
jgi:prepilin-type N-terminal cleavage/methylation domain-containing protein